MGCWIGLTDEAQQGGFSWNDGSAVDFTYWGPGEPNGWNGGTLEDQVMLMFFTPFTRNGKHTSDPTRFPKNIPDKLYGDEGDWNDADGSAAGAVTCAGNDAIDCRFGQSGLFPLCQVSGPPAPAPGASMVWGTGASASFRVQVCVDRIDTLHFQDDRLWFAYGGFWGAVGASDSCPDRYKGKAYLLRSTSL